MQLYDKDLLSVQEVRTLVEKAKNAQKELALKNQREVDEIVSSIAEAGVRNARRLAKMACEETCFGICDDKAVKNVFASRGVYEHIRDMKTIGELEYNPEKKLRKIAVPVGVIAGLIPSTNPTSTALYKSEIAVKSGNAIVFSPSSQREELYSGNREGNPAGHCGGRRKRGSGKLHYHSHRPGYGQSAEASGYFPHPGHRRYSYGPGGLFLRNAGYRRGTGKWACIY